MVQFWFFAILMLAVAIALPARALLSSRKLAAISTEKQNIAVARDRLAEMEQEYSRGEMSDEEIQNYRSEVSRLLASDIATTEQTSNGVEQQVSPVASVIIIALFIPLLSLLLYQQLGRPEFIASQPQTQVQADATASAANMSMEEMVQRLQQRLEQEPDNQEGWYMLARSYIAMQKYPEAVAAYEKLYQLTGDEPVVLLSLADALAMVQNGSMEGRPTQLINKVLQLEPANPTGLWLAGHAARERGELQLTLEYWQKAAVALQDQPDELAILQSQLTQLAQEMGVIVPQVTAIPQVSPIVSAETSSAVAIRLQVSLDPTLQERVESEDTLFIFAKAVNGPPMPLAAVRKTVADLPLQVVLDDSLAMMPAAKISNFETVEITARVSKSGQPGSQSGDLFGKLEPVATTTTATHSLIINQLVP